MCVWYLTTVSSIYNSTVIVMLPPCSSSLVSSSHSYDETTTNRHPRNDAAASLEPTLAARSTCATKDVTRWFSRWWSGSIVSTPTPVVLFNIQSTYKNRLSCGVALFSFKSTKEDPIVVVSAMACHLPAWPPVGTTGASLMISSSTVAA